MRGESVKREGGEGRECEEGGRERGRERGREVRGESVKRGGGEKKRGGKE